MRIWLTALLLILPAPYEAQAPSDPTGTYVCRGMDRGEPYALDLQVQPVGEGYWLQWFLDGEPSHLGIGMFKAGRLAVALMGANCATGVVFYDWTAGTLRGSWMNAEGAQFPETCTLRTPGASL